jgi:hypothetical protein
MNALHFAVAAFFTSLVSSIAQGQPFTDLLGITVERKADLSPAPYGIWLASSALLFDGGYAVAPDGTVFHNYSTEFTHVSNLSEPELTSRFAGTWTLYNFFGVPAAQAPELHQFTVSSLLLTDSFPSIPSLLSPMERDVVPRKFEVVTSSGSFQLYGGDGKFKSLDPNHTEVLLNFPGGVDQQSLGIRAYDAQTSQNFSATPLAPDPARKFFVNVSHRSYSPERTITVLNVPEPLCGSLALVTIIAAPLWRRRQL